MIEISESVLILEFRNDCSDRSVVLTVCCLCVFILILGPIQTHDKGINGCTASSVMGL